MEDKIYVPNYTNQCVSVIDKDTIRVYDSIHSNYNTYTDYYINSHYLWKKGSVGYVDVDCLSSDFISTKAIYRSDILDIFIIALLFIFVGYFFISKLVRTIFLGWRWS